MRLLILTCALVISLFFISCEKVVQYDGTVYNKAGAAVGNVEVRFWYGDSEDSFVAEMTNESGVFVFNKRLQKGRKVKELTVNSLQGSAARVLRPEGEMGMKVELK